jgi:hypothetical protein
MRFWLVAAFSGEPPRPAAGRPRRSDVHVSVTSVPPRSRDDPGALYRYIATGNPWLSFEVYPVLDVTESTPKPAEAIQTAKAAFSASRAP